MERAWDLHLIKDLYQYAKPLERGLKLVKNFDKYAYKDPQ